MLSYREYKLLNESLLAAGPMALGLRTPNSLGVMGSQPEMTEEEALEEAKKKGKKKMLAVEPEPEPEEEEEAPEDVEDVKEKIKLKLGKKDDDEEDVEDVEDEEVEDEEDVEDVEEVPMAKKKAKKCAGKKCGKGMKQESLAMSKDDQDWWTSVNRMVNADPNERFWDGMGPKPGEPGYAPQTRIGEEPAGEPTDVPEGEATDAPEGEEATEEQRARTGWSANYPPAYFSAQYPKNWMNPRKATTDLDAQQMGRTKK